MRKVIIYENFVDKSKICLQIERYVLEWQNIHNSLQD